MVNEIFEVTLKSENKDGTHEIKIFPEEKDGNLTGRYVCKDDLQSVHDMGEYEADCHDTIHFTNKQIALNKTIEILKTELILLGGKYD